MPPVTRQMTTEQVLERVTSWKQNVDSVMDDPTATGRVLKLNSYLKTLTRVRQAVEDAEFDSSQMVAYNDAMFDLDFYELRIQEALEKDSDPVRSQGTLNASITSSNGQDGGNGNPIPPIDGTSSSSTVTPVLHTLPASNVVNLPHLNAVANNGNASALPGGNTAVPSISGCSIGPTSNVKLHKLSLKRFSGKREDFPEWWEMYRLAIHENSSYSPVEKFLHLKTLLDERSKAYSCVAGFITNAENYAKAIANLASTFGDCDTLIDHYMSQIMNLKAVVTCEAGPLRAFYNKVVTVTRSLESLGIDQSNYASIVKKPMLDKLPLPLAEEYLKQFGTHDRKLDSLVEFLSKQVQIKEYCKGVANKQVPNKGDLHQRSHKKWDKPGRGHRNPTGAMLPAVGEKPCLQCKRGHLVSTCREFLKLSNKDKTSLLKANGRCFNCLDGTHYAPKCDLRPSCKICKEAHHTAWHKNATPRKLVAEPCKHVEKPKLTKSTKEVSTGAVVGMQVYDCAPTVLQTAHVRLPNKSRDLFMSCNAMFDTGASFTFGLISAFEKLGLKPKTTTQLTIATMGQPGKLKSYPVYEVEVQRADGGNGVTIEVIGVQSICTIPSAHLKVDDYPELSGLSLADDYGTSGTKTIAILIGCDTYSKFLTGDLRLIGDRLTALDTIFGYVLFGNHSDGNKASPRGNAMFVSEHKEMEALVRSTWELDALGIVDHEKPIPKLNEDLITDYSNERYQVKLPVKPNLDKLVPNRAVAAKRLERTFKKLSPPEFRQFSDVLEDLVEENVVEKVPWAPAPPKHEYYLPIRPLFKPSSTSTPVRPVFDASCKTASGISLNDCLEVGDNFLPHLMKLILQFREGLYAFSADIRKAFLMIEIHPEHRDLLRFLWVDAHGNIVAMRLVKLPFGLNCSPNILQLVIRLHAVKYEQEYPEAVKALLNRLYVDDLLPSYGELGLATKVAMNSKAILKEAGMMLTKFHSNSPDLLRAVGEEPVDTGCQEPVALSNTVNGTKVLGIKWAPEKDTLSFDCSSISVPEQVTKQTILSTVAKVFDPCGFIAPISITIKILLQNLWRCGLKWDEEVPSELKRTFLNWVTNIKDIETIPSKHCCFESFKAQVTVEIHVFCDSSQDAYGSCVYLRVVSDNVAMTTLMAAKAGEVSHLQELLAALADMQCSEHCGKCLEMPIRGIELWTDFQVTLARIPGNPARCKPFVANGVRSNQELRAPATWNSVTLTEIPVGLVSCSCYGCTLLASNKKCIVTHEVKALPSAEVEQSHIVQLASDEAIPHLGVGLEFELQCVIQCTESTSYPIGGVGVSQRHPLLYSRLGYYPEVWIHPADVPKKHPCRRYNCHPDALDVSTEDTYTCHLEAQDESHVEEAILTLLKKVVQALPCWRVHPQRSNRDEMKHRRLPSLRLRCLLHH